MGISSNTLWHQTKKDGLKGIISKRCLYYAYSQEDLLSIISNYRAEFAFPMISVCDLPLSETGNYLKKYGDYTIGLSADWGRRNGFSTVWYCDKNSKTLSTILLMFARMIGDYGFDTSRSKDYQRIIYLLSHVKQYDGPLPKKNFKNYRFYDEREQRLVPDFDSLNNLGEQQFIINYEEYKASHKKSPLLPKSLNVPFELNDIKYIIVEREDEKEEFRELVQKSYGRNEHSISYLTNREVKEDIIGLAHDIEEGSRPLTEQEIDEIINGLGPLINKK